MGRTTREDTPPVGNRWAAGAFEHRLARHRRLNPHTAELWLDFAVRGLGSRQVIDDRTRYLVQISQLTMLKSPTHLEDAIRAAARGNLEPREILEVILQCAVYGGAVAVDPALEVYDRVVEELGLELDGQTEQSAENVRNRADPPDERGEGWDPEDMANPRRKELMARYGHEAVARGMKLRPKHHLQVLAWLDALDTEWAALWERFIYGGMYSRGIIDDKTRLLCMVANCVAVNEAGQGREHMKGALRAGAKPREVMEVIILSSTYIGMPYTMSALKSLVAIMRDEGRLAEIGNPPHRP